MFAIVVILLAVVFIGGAMAVLRSGEKDGICYYGQVGDDDVQD